MILVVDDEPALVDVIRSVLTDEGHDVVTANDGLTALEYLRGAPRPCLTILDLMMPRMNGWELRLAMLSEPSLADIPVAIVSAFTEGDMSSLRAAAVIQKPFHLAEILELAERHCGAGG